MDKVKAHSFKNYYYPNITNKIINKYIEIEGHSIKDYSD